ncbi:uncharacterized protein M421DRAFT_76557 [Didymella exigua CBS 183.55]|uniref:50S ribosomal protein YmL27 n=1 Tax=Didymella exigua CBS 183.55 TaxID=1150837 RepID=A0A6A5R6W2_9PLEO|nr:uncharacterized protein M421DRAFT_76557 [Didymella exigua CBS 183.55]KAF1922960.1 hypothetical protein M421DRAFT_76557 [Didymella exigua CBS 183.55]
MFKPTPALQGTLRRLPLSTKQAGREYYKGNRVGSMGTINRYGKFTPDWNKIRTYVFPVHGVKNAELTPFVAETVQKTRTTDSNQSEVYPKRFTGEDYLRAWKMAGGHDIVYEEASATRPNMPAPFEERKAS